MLSAVSVIFFPRCSSLISYCSFAWCDFCFPVQSLTLLYFRLLSIWHKVMTGCYDLCFRNVYLCFFIFVLLSLRYCLFSFCHKAVICIFYVIDISPQLILLRASSVQYFWCSQHTQVVDSMRSLTHSPFLFAPVQLFHVLLLSTAYRFLSKVVRVSGIFSSFPLSYVWCDLYSQSLYIE